MPWGRKRFLLATPGESDEEIDATLTQMIGRCGRNAVAGVTTVRDHCRGFPHSRQPDLLQIREVFLKTFRWIYDPLTGTYAGDEQYCNRRWACLEEILHHCGTAGVAALEGVMFRDESVILLRPEALLFYDLLSASIASFLADMRDVPGVRHLPLISLVADAVNSAHTAEHYVLGNNIFAYDNRGIVNAIVTRIGDILREYYRIFFRERDFSVIVQTIFFYVMFLVDATVCLQAVTVHLWTRCIDVVRCLSQSSCSFLFNPAFAFRLADRVEEAMKVLEEGNPFGELAAEEGLDVAGDVYLDELTKY
jgi:hypothetical protein